MAVKRPSCGLDDPWFLRVFWLAKFDNKLEILGVHWDDIPRLVWFCEDQVSKFASPWDVELTEKAKQIEFVNLQRHWERTLRTIFASRKRIWTLIHMSRSCSEKTVTAGCSKHTCIHTWPRFLMGRSWHARRSHSIPFPKLLTWRQNLPFRYLIPMPLYSAFQSWIRSQDLLCQVEEVYINLYQIYSSNDIQSN